MCLVSFGRLNDTNRYLHTDLETPTSPLILLRHGKLFLGCCCVVAAVQHRGKWLIYITIVFNKLSTKHREGEVHLLFTIFTKQQSS